MRDSASVRLVERLRSGEPVFGVFAGDGKRAIAEKLASDERVDFVFYDMEEGPFDGESLERMEVFLHSLEGRPMVTRLPPIRDGFAEAEERARRLVSSGVDGVVFPHIENRAQAEHAVRSTAPSESIPTVSTTPGLPLAILIIEDRAGVENAGEIVSTPAVSVVIPGPGDLRRAYDGDDTAVDRAIETVLAAAKAEGVVCGITAGSADMEKRLRQGFRFMIATSHDALGVGR
jgi:4-hydroxy-2-oxoheptanedioate aldolase